MQGNDTQKDKKTVLFADDSQSILQTAERVLRQQGCEFIAVTTGLQALARCAESRPDLVFIDKDCPQLNGFQFCALLKAREEYRELPVVLLSDCEDIFEQARAQALGAAGILIKPFSQADLLNVAAVGSTHAA